MIRNATPSTAPTAAPTVVMCPLEEAFAVDEAVIVIVAVGRPEVLEVSIPEVESEVRLVLNGYDRSGK